MTDITLLLDSSTIAGAQSHDFTLQLPSPLDLHDLQHEAGLVSLQMWNTWYNISAELGNNLFEYYNSTTWETITIPDGNYNLETLESALHEALEQAGDWNTISNTSYINFKPNYSTQKIFLEVVGGYQVDFTVGKINMLLGFDAAIVAVSQYGANRADLNNGINQLLLHCSLINGGMYVNKSRSDVLHSFVPAAPPGASLEFNYESPIYVAVQDLRFIHNIQVTLTDQKGRSIPLNGSPIALKLHIRPRKTMTLDQRP